MIPTKQSLAYWLPPVLTGLSHDYRNLSSWLVENLVPDTAQRFWETETFCLTDNSNFYANDNMGSYFVRGYSSWNDTVVQDVVESAGIMGRRATPVIPWYLYEVSSLCLMTLA